MHESDFGFSRDRILSGASARRATLLLFAIESRTAQAMQQARPLNAYAATDGALQAREQAFYAAVAAGRDLPFVPAVQDLERYAPLWAALVPADAETCAGTAHLIAQKHTLHRARLPQLRAALRLDSPEVAAAYAQLYGQPLDSIYAPRQSVGDQVRWGFARVSQALEGLPPFWMAFILTLPLGSGLLALPISFARIGTVPALVLLFAFGLISLVTVGALAETTARSGMMRYGLGFLGGLVGEYLGALPAAVLSIVFAINNFLLLVVFYLGIGQTLQTTLGIPAPFWFGVLAAIGIYFLSRPNLNTTVSFSLVIVLVTAAAVLILFAATLPHIRPENLAAPADLSGASGTFDPAVLQLVFGTLITAYLSHVLVATFGGVVIRRDQGASAWMRGCLAAIIAMIVINALWVIAMHGALGTETLAAQTGTIIEPLVPLAGPVVSVVGSFLVVISLGLVTIYASIGLYFTLQERLPALQTRIPALRAPRWAFALSASPVAAALILSIWLSLTGGSSFSGMLAFLGVIALPLISGVFPILLIIATRRKGDYVPALVIDLLGNPALMAILYAVYVGMIFAYAFVIWGTTAERAATLVAGLAVVGVTGSALRGVGLRHRLVIEVVADEGAPAGGRVSIVESGRDRPTAVTLHAADGRETTVHTPAPVDVAAHRALTVTLTPGAAREIKLWVHRLTADGKSIAIAYTAALNAAPPATHHGSTVLECQPGQPITLRLEWELPA
ncbi:MAG: hypothetical protein SF162_20445 [bacterium]|nr:hypothetical protein [bacterium]